MATDSLSDVVDWVADIVDSGIVDSDIVYSSLNLKYKTVLRQKGIETLVNPEPQR